MSQKQYMQLALDLAATAAGRTSPNPPVGAVIVHGNEIVGRGFHPRAGEPHAEVFALREAGVAASGATIFVSLEPCNHHGRTGPCTDAIINAGITHVVVGVLDPNPLVSGQGVKRLQDAGLKVTVGILEEQCRQLIAPFAKHITTGLPFVTLKMAMTLDGQTATSSGDSQWISGEESRLEVHRMRDRSDAIMVGIGTVLADNPQLTTRLPHGGRDPIRITVDSQLRIPDSARILDANSSTPTWIVTTAPVDEAKAETLTAVGAEIIIVPEKEKQVDLQAMMVELGRRGVQSVLMEGGAGLASAALKCKVVDRVAIFVAPKILGGDDGTSLLSGSGVVRLSEAIQLKAVRTQMFSDDILIEGEIL